MNGEERSEEERVDIFDPGALVALYEPSWDALQLTEEERKPQRAHLRDIAARHDLDAIRRFGERAEATALDMELATDMAVDAGREIREIAGDQS